MIKYASILLLAATQVLADRPPDWLRLPSPGDKRPGSASAWILENSESDIEQADGTVTTRFRYAVMPITDAGAKHGNWAFAYTAGSTSVTFAKAWAMSPDGSKCREFGGTDFVVFSPTVSNWVWDQTRAISFDPQRYLQSGWIFACEVEVRSDSSPFDVHWNPRGGLPVRHALLQLVPPPGGSVRWKAPAGMPAPKPGGGGSLTWSVDSLEPYEVETPSHLTRVGTELRAYMLNGSSESKTWADVVRLSRHEMDPKSVATPATAAISNREAGKGGLWERIAPVCRYVQKRITYLEVAIENDSMAGYRPHSAGEVCDNLYGDCKDKATLLRTVLGGLGVESYVMLVNSGEPTANVADWPSAYFNHAIVAIPCSEPPPAGSTCVRVDGRDYLLFDPTDDEVPFGLLPEQDAGGLGLVLAPGIDAAAQIPMTPPEKLAVSAKLKMTVAEDGSAAIEVSEDRFGLEAAAALYNDVTRTEDRRQASLEEKIQRRLPLFTDLVWKDHDEMPEGDWEMTARFTAQSLGKRMRGGMYVPTDLLSVVPFPAPWNVDSPGWVSIRPGTLAREVTIIPPSGWEIAQVPEDWTYRSTAGQGSIHYEKSDHEAVGHFKLMIRGGVLDRKSYLEYQDLLVAALAAERIPLVLTHPKPAQAAAH